MVIAIFVNRAYHKYTQGYNFPIQTPPKKISVSEQWVIFWGSPLFLAIWGHSPITSISTLNFGPFSMKLVGTVRAIKEMTQNEDGPRPGRIYRETAVFMLSRKVFFWPKSILTKKNECRTIWHQDNLAPRVENGQFGTNS